MSKIKNKIKRFFLFISIFKSMLLSHHPNCEHYDEHVYHIGKFKFCIGCFTFYPVVAITAILTFFFFDLQNPETAFFLFLISHIFVTPVFLSLLKLTKYKIIKISSKISVGIGVGFYIMATVFLPIHIIMKIFFIAQVNFLTGIIAYIRTKHILKDCAACEYKGDWSTCPTMKPIIENLVKHGFMKEEEVLKMKKKGEVDQKAQLATKDNQKTE